MAKSKKPAKKAPKKAPKKSAKKAAKKAAKKGPRSACSLELSRRAKAQDRSKKTGRFR